MAWYEDTQDKIRPLDLTLRHAPELTTRETLQLAHLLKPNNKENPKNGVATRESEERRAKFNRKSDGRCSIGIRKSELSVRDLHRKSEEGIGRAKFNRKLNLHLLPSGTRFPSTRTANFFNQIICNRHNLHPVIAGTGLKLVKINNEGKQQAFYAQEMCSPKCSEMILTTMVSFIVLELRLLFSGSNSSSSFMCSQDLN
ncbi:hypothetical protein R6Q57_016465 [Mikania cordata]